MAAVAPAGGVAPGAQHRVPHPRARASGSAAPADAWGAEDTEGSSHGGVWGGRQGGCACVRTSQSAKNLTALLGVTLRSHHNGLMTLSGLGEAPDWHGSPRSAWEPLVGVAAGPWAPDRPFCPSWPAAFP